MAIKLRITVEAEDSGLLNSATYAVAQAIEPHKEVWAQNYNLAPEEIEFVSDGEL